MSMITVIIRQEASPSILVSGSYIAIRGRGGPFALGSVPARWICHGTGTTKD